MSKIRIERALISVSDKSGIADLAAKLSERGVEILSTGGTLRTLVEAGIPAKAIDDYTGFPEMMDGRLKTLHPRIHGGLLALLDNESHRAAMAEHQIESIDLVVVNLYPFAATVARGAGFAEAIENIDIGGPTMLRAAAKNYRFTSVLCDPADYALFLESFEKNGGAISVEESQQLSRKVFNHTAAYDAMIADYLNREADDRFPEKLTLTYERISELRYGENPHQKAAHYRPAADLASERLKGLSGAEQLQGKELSFNNLLDFSAALDAVLSLKSPGAVIVKHLNPCGAAIAPPGEPISRSFELARRCDPISAFGGVIALSAPCDAAVAALIAENFAEGVIAPYFSDEALEILSAKKGLRLMRLSDPQRFRAAALELRQVYDGVLWQERDIADQDGAAWRCVTKRAPSPQELIALDFSWRVVRSIKSNAILFCDHHSTIGIGAGQMSRVDSVELAIAKAKKSGLSLVGSVVASDAFFPFRDGLDALAAAGAVAVIQPGGSVRDQEVIDAADEHGIAMLFTGMRHFRH